MTQDQSGRKRLNELRVVDLRNELERRSLNTTGVKSALLERLQSALRDEGLDPETHEFEVSAFLKVGGFQVLVFPIGWAMHLGATQNNCSLYLDCWNGAYVGVCADRDGIG